MSEPRYKKGERVLWKRPGDGLLIWAVVSRVESSMVLGETGFANGAPVFGEVERLYHYDLNVTHQDRLASTSDALFGVWRKGEHPYEQPENVRESSLSPWSAVDQLGDLAR